MLNVIDLGRITGRLPDRVIDFAGMRSGKEATVATPGVVGQTLISAAKAAAWRRFFTEWYGLHGRIFPWRKSDACPYEVLVTEVLLRQTRASLVAEVWTEFMAEYPTVGSLASAEADVLRERIHHLGLSYQRSDALKAVSTAVTANYGGAVPIQTQALLGLPHVGPYTANAVQCFGHNRPVAIVDVNVLRVLTRYCRLPPKRDIRRSPESWLLANSWLPSDLSKVKDHNYGLLDFASQVCTARAPRCDICPLAKLCSSGSNGGP